MNLDYRLHPNSPLLQPDTFRRLTLNPTEYLLQQQLMEKVERETRFDPLVLSRQRHREIEAIAPKHSLMTHEEADALLTELGTVWFISQATGLAHFEAARLYAAGLPWPLREVGDEGQWSEGVFTPAQRHHLNQLFQPVANQALVLCDLLLNSWAADNQPKDGPVHQVRGFWQRIADETGEDVDTVKRVAIALHVYYSCLQNFVKQQVKARRLDQRDTE